jgi:general secretion pathway protein J
LPLRSSLSDQLHFGEPVLLLRAPYRLSFAYAGSSEDRSWKSSWRDSEKLPARIRLTVRDASTERVVAVSTVTPVHVQSPAIGDCTQPDGKCDGKGAAPGTPQANPQQTDPQTPSPTGGAGRGNSS